MQKAILRLMVILIPLCFTSHLSAQTIHLGTIKVPTYKVTGITPEYTEDGSLMLTAEINRPVKPPLRIIWRFKGDDHGYAFLSDEGESVALSIGEQETGVVVEACLAEGERSGGCRSITLTAALLDQVQDEAAWRDLLVPDFTEPDFICQVLDDDQYQFIFYEVSSRVHTVTGEYLREKEDLSVKAPGGMLSIKRHYQAGGWTWDHERHDLTLVRGPEGGIESILKGTTRYRAVSDREGVFTDGIYHILKTDEGFRWESKNGLWKRYNNQGSLTAYGDRNGVTGRILFQDGLPFCLSDRNNQGVLWFEYDDSGLLRTVYDQNNRGVTYRYREGRLSAVTDVLGNETRFSYDEEGRLEEILAPEGAKTHITYDQLGRVVSTQKQGREAEPESIAGHTFTWDYDKALSLYYVRIEDPSGKFTEIWSNKEGQARRVDINGRTVHEIKEKGNTLEITDSRGLTTHKTFDQRRNVLEIVYPDGSRIKREYEPRFNRKTKEINENGIITLFSYDDKGNLVQKTEASGTPDERVTLYTYDQDGNLLSIRQPGNQHTREAVTLYAYDAFGNRTMETDPEGNITEYMYNALGRVITRTDARGKGWNYAYDQAGRLKTTTDPLGNRTEFYYDAAGNKVREVDPNGRVQLFAYDWEGNLIRVTDAAGKETLFEYNADNKLVRQIDPEGRSTRYEYDTEGRLIKTIDGAGNEIVTAYEETTIPGCPSCPGGIDAQPSHILYPTFEKAFTYDLRGRKIIEKEILSETEEYETLFNYDDLGNLIAKTDKEGRTTTHNYDSLNRLTRVMDPLNQETLYSYDNRDNLIRLTDAKGQTTQFEYDLNNRLVKEVRPMGQETLYGYDGGGNLIEKLDAKGRKTQYHYDDAGRLTKVLYYSAADHKTPIKTVTFAYDAAGNLISYNDGTTSAKYLYDHTYRKISETVNYGAFEKSYSYTYYDNGFKKTYTDPEGVTYTYAYNENNQLTEVWIPGHGSITHTSYNWTRPAAVTLPGGSTKNYLYDSLMRLKQITSRDPGKNVIVDYQYEYDRMDNITTKATEHGEHAYDYDDFYRLINADNPVLSDEDFTYDPVGNRLTSSSAGNWAYNPNNELQSYNGVSFKYDANGNTIQKIEGSEVINYIYNDEGRLVRVGDNTSNVISEYYYDPFGRRLWKEIDGERTCFLYSDEGLVAEMDETGNVIKSYGWQPGSTWTTDPLFMKQGAQYYFYHNDHLGTPQKMTSASGAVVWSAKYEAFGRAEVEIETVVNNLRFPGHYYDVDDELHYNYWRYYDPNIGRYLLPDPIGLDGGINFYSYADNNPIVLFDSRGLACGSWWNDWAITDKPDGYDFAKCCQDHDDCYVGKYNQCFKGKGTCDEEFYECMERYCRRKHLGDNRCLHYSAKYWSAVVSYDPAFWAFYQARKKPPCNQCYE